ncbi:MAG: helix-turn-helix domain-containing protein [Desulfamplus sp.]|nr:helix-turn-helix domain-containing protein [Desulfamplus sp.]
MDDELFKDLIASAKELVSIEKGHKKPKIVHEISVPEAKAIRKNLAMSQRDFANTFGINVKTLQDWEQGRRNPVGPAAVLLRVIAKNPASVLDVVSA